MIELSLDGYMAVAIEKTDSVAAGESVSVTLSDGTVVTGTDGYTGKWQYDITDHR